MQSILLFYSTYFLFRGNELQKILLLSLNGSRSENSDYCNLTRRGSGSGGRYEKKRGAKIL